MTVTIRPYTAADYERVLQICISAFTPYHRYLEETLGAPIFAAKYQGWEERYAAYLEKIGTDTSQEVYVAANARGILGFVFVIFDAVRGVGEIGLNAVDPQTQGRGIGKAMYAFALARLKERGASVAYVGTGSDHVHAPARSAYEKIGFNKAVHGVHYFKDLRDA